MDFGIVLDSVWTLFSRILGYSITLWGFHVQLVSVLIFSVLLGVVIHFIERFYS